MGRKDGIAFARPIRGRPPMLLIRKRLLTGTSGGRDDPSIAAPLSRQKDVFLFETTNSKSAQPSRPGLRLRLLCITDPHVNLYPYDYYRDCPDDAVGLARAAPLARGGAPGGGSCHFVSSPLPPLAGSSDRGRPPCSSIPSLWLTNTLDCAAATFGNHDFNYGLDVLERAYCCKPAFRSSSCNVRNRDAWPGFPPSIVIEREFVDKSGTVAGTAE